MQTENDPSIVQDNVDFLLHVDNHTTVSGGSFNATTNITTFSGVGWLNTVTTPNYDLVVIDDKHQLSKSWTVRKTYSIRYKFYFTR